MNQNVTDIVAGIAGLLATAWVAVEISRRRAKLRELYDVLDRNDRKLTKRLEDLVTQGKLTPL